MKGHCVLNRDSVFYAWPFANDIWREKLYLWLLEQEIKRKAERKKLFPTDVISRLIK
jgi:hypothetical protein